MRLSRATRRRATRRSRTSPPRPSSRPSRCHTRSPPYVRGYPGGLTADEIPEVAEIIAVADCFDAMYTNRPYRKRTNFEKAVPISSEGYGTQLLPRVVNAFLEIASEFTVANNAGGGSTENIEDIRKKAE